MRRLVLVVLSSCSAPTISLESMPAEVSKTICAKYYECCMAAEVKGNPFVGPDQTACETNYKSLLDVSGNFAKQSETKMRLVYHGDKLASCMASYKQLTCAQLKKGDPTSMISDCKGVFEPKLGTSAGCAQDNECISGSCRGATTGSDGACQPKSGEGSSCADADCADGTYCKSGAGTDGGSAQTCVSLKSDSTACFNNSECSTGGCNGKNPDGGMPNMGTCGEKGGPGTTCFATDGCSAAGGLPLILLATLALKRRRRS